MALGKTLLLTFAKLIFKELFKDEKEDLFLWRQTPEKWCLLEILCHLYDEEREDFRFRTKWVLERPNETPPPFNPIDWVTERKYVQQNYKSMLDKFLAERDDSIGWLINGWSNIWLKTNNGGQSWEEFLNLEDVNSESFGNIRSLFFTDESTGFGIGLEGVDLGITESTVLDRCKIQVVLARVGNGCPLCHALAEQIDEMAHGLVL